MDASAIARANGIDIDRPRPRSFSLSETDYRWLVAYARRHVDTLESLSASAVIRHLIEQERRREAGESS